MGNGVNREWEAWHFSLSHWANREKYRSHSHNELFSGL